MDCRIGKKVIFPKGVWKFSFQHLAFANSLLQKLARLLQFADGLPILI